jgi:seryl-tRNA synthetase
LLKQQADLLLHVNEELKQDLLRRNTVIADIQQEKEMLTGQVMDLQHERGAMARQVQEMQQQREALTQQVEGVIGQVESMMKRERQTVELAQKHQSEGSGFCLFLLKSRLYAMLLNI